LTLPNIAHPVLKLPGAGSYSFRHKDARVRYQCLKCVEFRSCSSYVVLSYKEKFTLPCNCMDFNTELWTVSTDTKVHYIYSVPPVSFSEVSRFIGWLDQQISQVLIF